jgi:hypothetical protein
MDDNLNTAVIPMTMEFNEEQPPAHQDGDKRDI